MALTIGFFRLNFNHRDPSLPCSPQKINPITQLESKALPPCLQLQSNALAASLLHNMDGERCGTAALSTNPETAAAEPSPRASPSPRVDPSCGTQQPHHPPTSTAEVSRTSQRWHFSPAAPGIALLLGRQRSSN